MDTQRSSNESIIAVQTMPGQAILPTADLKPGPCWTVGEICFDTFYVMREFGPHRGQANRYRDRMIREDRRERLNELARYEAGF